MEIKDIALVIDENTRRGKLQQQGALGRFAQRTLGGVWTGGEASGRIVGPRPDWLRGETAPSLSGGAVGGVLALVNLGPAVERRKKVGKFAGALLRA